MPQKVDLKGKIISGVKVKTLYNKNKFLYSLVLHVLLYKAFVFFLFFHLDEEEASQLPHRSETLNNDDIKWGDLSALAHCTAPLHLY